MACTATTAATAATTAAAHEAARAIGRSAGGSSGCLHQELERSKWVFDSTQESKHGFPAQTSKTWVGPAGGVASVERFAVLSKGHSLASDAGQRAMASDPSCRKKGCVRLLSDEFVSLRLFLGGVCLLLVCVLAMRRCRVPARRTAQDSPLERTVPPHWQGGIKGCKAMGVPGANSTGRRNSNSPRRQFHIAQ